VTVNDKLAEFAAGRTKTKQADIWTPPTLERMPRHANIVAADPSLSAFGLVHVLVRNHYPQVLSARKLTTASPFGGPEANLDRAQKLTDALVEVIGAWVHARESEFGVPCWVHELPPASGPSIRRPEAAYLASLAFRHACLLVGLGPQRQLAPISPQRHAKLMTGKGNAGKPERREAFPGIAQGLAMDMDLLRNADTRDGASVALCALVDNVGVLGG
jgi:hypothetical protein